MQLPKALLISHCESMYQMVSFLKITVCKPLSASFLRALSLGPLDSYFSNTELQVYRWWQHIRQEGIYTNMWQCAGEDASDKFCELNLVTRQKWLEPAGSFWVILDNSWENLRLFIMNLMEKWETYLSIHSSVYVMTGSTQSPAVHRACDRVGKG